MPPQKQKSSNLVPSQPRTGSHTHNPQPHPAETPNAERSDSQSNDPTAQSITPQTAAMAASASQKRHGRAKGLQGYSAADCLALVAAVKEVLPLGSQDCLLVLTRYNKYAEANDRAN